MKPTILVAEDDPQLRAFIQTLLTKEEYTVVAAEDGRECERVLQSFPRIDLLILDLDMPEVNGIDIIRSVRQNIEFINLPIVITTTHAQSEIVKKAIYLGANDYLVKPFTEEALLERVSNLLFNLDDASLQNILASLNIADSSLLNNPGLTAYRQANVAAYPVLRSEKNFCVLIPHEVKPGVLRKFTAAELQKNIMIFIRHRSWWLKVWPKQSSKPKVFSAIQQKDNAATLRQMHQNYAASLDAKVKEIERILLDLSKSWSDGALQKLYRIVHTLSGTAPIMGQASIGSKAQELEEFMKPLFEQKSKWNDDAKKTVLQKAQTVIDQILQINETEI